MQVTTNDLNTTGGGSPHHHRANHDQHQRREPPPLVISELMFNPPDIDPPNEYIEIRSAVPNYTIPNGTYSDNGLRSADLGSTRQHDYYLRAGNSLRHF